MKQVTAIVKPYLAEQVLDAIKRMPIEAVSVVEVKGYGRQKSYLDQYSESAFSMAFLPKVEIHVWIAAEHAEQLMRQMVEVARTGRMGDGKIFVQSTVPGVQVIEF